MSLNNWMNNSEISSTTSWKVNSQDVVDIVAEILDSSEPVFQVAILKNQKKPSPVFFKPPIKIDSPFDGMFIAANIWLKKYNTGDFTLANIWWENEPHVYKARCSVGNNWYRDYLMPRFR